MRRLRVFVLVLGFAAVATGSGQMEQTVQPITPTVEQRIDVLTPSAEQRVEMVDPNNMQAISGDATDSGATRAAKAVGKVVLTVVGAAVACGAMVASLLFI